jgi:acyl carrier protein
MSTAGMVDRTHLRIAIDAVTQVLRHKDSAPAEIGPATKLADLHFDSLDLAETLILIELETGCEIDTEWLTSIVALADLAALVEHAHARASR